MRYGVIGREIQMKSRTLGLKTGKFFAKWEVSVAPAIEQTKATTTTTWT